MYHKRGYVCLAMGAVAGLLVGCGPKMTMEQMKDMMKKTHPRPAELDHLDVLVGSWESEGDMMFCGIDGKMTMKGSSTASWDVDRRCVVERMQGEMEGCKYEAIGIWSWDAHDKEFHTYWADNMGESGLGTGKYDPATKTWTMKGKGRDPHSGEMKQFSGTLTMPDNNTINWTHVEKNMWGMKTMEMKGTSKRKM